MTDYRTDLEHDLDRVGPASFTFDDVTDRRDRKRLNKRITAGVVGIGVFVAAVWVVTSGLSFDRSETPIAPGPTFTQPGTGGHLGPGESFGPSVTGPVIGPSGDLSSLGYDGLPPEGIAASGPLRGELVMSDEGINPWWHVRLYADGRLIWALELPPDEVEGGPDVSGWIEQRLTPEGVELLRFGAVPLRVTGPSPSRQLPVSAWEDPTPRPYVPSRYAVCTASLAALPGSAADLLRRAERISAGTSRYIDGAECFEVTTSDARTLAEILSDAGFDGPRAADTALYSSDANDVTVEYQLILPDGEVTVAVGG